MLLLEVKQSICFSIQLCRSEEIHVRAETLMVEMKREGCSQLRIQVCTQTLQLYQDRKKSRELGVYEQDNG